MDHPLRSVSGQIPPTFWRSAAMVAILVAAVELVLLVVTGTALLLRHGDSTTSRGADTPAKAEAAPQHAARASAHRGTPRPAAPKLARGKVGVMVLNGNGRHGAAAAAAARIRHHGYRVGFVGNAARMSYARSIVMFRRGFEGEGRRFARDLGIRTVGPLDGMRPAQLHGSQVVVILGS